MCEFSKIDRPEDSADFMKFEPKTDDIYIRGDRRPGKAQEGYEDGMEQTNTVKIHDSFAFSGMDVEQGSDEYVLECEMNLN